MSPNSRYMDWGVLGFGAYDLTAKTVNRALSQELLLTLTASRASQAQGVLCLGDQDREDRACRQKEAN